MLSSKKLSVGLVGIATLALASLHTTPANACSIACENTPRVANRKLVSPVIKMPTFTFGYVDQNAPAPSLRRGDVAIPITSVRDGGFGHAIAAAEPLEPGEYTLVTSNGCGSNEVTSSFTVLPSEPIPTEPAEIFSTSKFEAASNEAAVDTCGTRHGEVFDHMNVDVEVRLPASLTPRFPLVRTTVSVSGPNVETRQEFTPQQATFNLYKLVVSCAGTSNKPQPGTYRVRVDSELLGVGKLAASDKEFQIVCPASTKPNDDPKTRDPWLGEGPTDDDPPSTPGNGGTSSSGSCSNSGGRPQGGALGLLLGAMGVALVARRRRR